MPQRLRILAGPSIDSLQPITSLVNTGQSFEISSDAFEGRIAVYIKGLPAEGDAVPDDSAYFDAADRKGVTWSIQAQGRFLQPHSADDILFGNTFDRPLNLPWGSGAALKLMSYIDPTLEQDLASATKPWALSPLVATMPFLSHTRTEAADPAPQFPSPAPLQDDASQLGLARAPDAVNEENMEAQTATADKRRAYFRDVARRKEIVFGPTDLLTTDFCYGFLEFHPTLSLRLPRGISIDLTRHWDGQQVRFVCCERGKLGKDGEPWGKTFWVVAIEPAPELSDSETGPDMTTGSDDVD